MTGDAAAPFPPSTVDKAWALRADAVAREVAATLAAAAIDAILIRGISIARHLYGPQETRTYVDADLLVNPAEATSAAALLGELGFRDVTGLGRRPDDRPAWASTWLRERDGGNVDLHWTIVGAHAGPAVVWRVLAAQSEPVGVLGQTVLGLDAAATATIVALHAAQHGVKVPRVREDLARALAQLDGRTWRIAAELAGAMDALDAFAFGLRLLPQGAQLAADLELPSRPSVETILRSEDAPPTALGFDWLSQTPGLAAKSRLIAGKIIPDRAFMREWFPPARRGGSAALVLGYLWRPVWLAAHAPAGLRFWVSARRAARTQRPPAGR